MPAIPAVPGPSRPTGRHALHPPFVVGDSAMTDRRVGEANSRGRFLRPSGFFRLDEDLSAPGAINFAEALAQVAADWDDQVAAGNISAALVFTNGYLLRSLGGFLASQGVTEVRHITANLLLAWCSLPDKHGAAPTRSSMLHRRSALRAFFDTLYRLSITDENPAAAVSLPGQSDRYVHPLTDSQVEQLRRVARSTLTDTRTPAALALCMSGAASEEIPFVTVADVDLPGRRVWLEVTGYRRYRRWLPLFDDWCVDAVAARVRAVRENAEGKGDPHNPWLTYQNRVGFERDPSRTRQSANGGGTILTKLMRRAGVYERGVTRAESIREWLAVTTYARTESLPSVAVLLGLSSLDSAAHLVGLDWLDDAGVDADPPAHRRQANSGGSE